MTAPVVRRLRAILAFAYDFVIGDDWRVAAAVLAALAATYGLSRLDVASWWLLPVTVVVILSVSLVRAAGPRG